MLRLIRTTPFSGARLRAGGVGAVFPFLCAGVGALLLTPVVHAQSTNLEAVIPARATAVVRRIEQPPVLDGRLDDACWQAAPVLTNFTQVVPFEGAAPSEHTRVRFVHTRDHLYLAIQCLDQAPDRIIARQMQRDSDFSSDDFVTIAFDTFDRRHDGYYFLVNPLGARTDGLIQNFSERKVEWDGLWEARCRVDDSGWTVELGFPFKSLSFDPTRDAWGCNIERVIRRKQEVVRWTVLSRAKSATSLSDFGQLNGLSELRQGLGLEMRPFISVKYQNDAATGEDWTFKPGADATYRITPELTANATINTDFAEAEVDDRIVNLTRFPVFFPEKRDFFLQDSSLFSFGGLGNSPTPYYSRRIGLSGDGQPVDIIAGGRLTGRIGRTQLAVLDVQQDSYDDVSSKNLFVGRGSVQVLEESNIGAILTHGDPRSDGDNLLLGADFNYLNSRLPEGRQLLGHAWIMGTDSDRYDSQDGAFGGVLDFPNEPFSARLTARQFGEEFDPALGFVPRRGVRDYIANSRYIWRPNEEWVRSFSLSTKLEVYTDLENRIVTEDHDILVARVNTPQGDGIELQYGSDRDVLDEPFEIQPGIIIPVGDYWDGHFKAILDSSDARALSGLFVWREGGFYTGDKRDFEWGFNWRPSHHFSTGAGYELTQVRLPEGDFDVHVVSVRANVGFTPDLNWLNLVQYDNLSDDFSLNSRVRWTWQPGSDLFLVFNNSWDLAEWRFERLQTEVVVKVGASIRF